MTRQALVHFFRALSLILIIFLVTGTSSQISAQTGRGPSDTVREFYKAMREKRFREAFSMSIYRIAIEDLTPAEFDDLRPDFERLAAEIPAQVNITGEQASGDSATVFIKIKDGENKDHLETVSLLRVSGVWIVGDRDNQEIVKQAGKSFFFNARIDALHDQAQALLRRIALSQLAYSQNNNGRFGDLAALIKAGLIPKDLEGTESTGYRFRVTLSPDAKIWTATAEPAQYGRTGRLSFQMDQSGLRSGDVGGKPLSKAP